MFKTDGQISDRRSPQIADNLEKLSSLAATLRSSLIYAHDNLDRVSCRPPPSLPVGGLESLSSIELDYTARIHNLVRQFEAIADQVGELNSRLEAI